MKFVGKIAKIQFKECLCIKFTQYFSGCLFIKRPHGINNHPQEIYKTANEFTGSFDIDKTP